MAGSAHVRTAADSSPATARAMVQLLRAHYIRDERQPAGVFAPEIQSPDGARKADLIWLGCTAAAGHKLVGHEIKVTRQDLLAELADPTKSDPWQTYCDRWWLVVPSSTLLGGLEIPDTWGVMTPPSGRRTRTMTVHRAAPELRPLDQSAALRTVAAWEHWQIRDLRVALARAEDRADRLRRENQELQLIGSHRENRCAQVVTRILADLGGVSGSDTVGEWGHEVNVDEVVAALRDLGVVQHRQKQVEWEIEHAAGSLRRLRDGAERLLREMGET